MQQNTTAAGASPDPLAGFKGTGSRRGEEGGKGKGRGKEREEKDREGVKEQGRLSLMHNWNRAADWLRPALPMYVGNTKSRRNFQFRCRKAVTRARLHVVIHRRRNSPK